MEAERCDEGKLTMPNMEGERERGRGVKTLYSSLLLLLPSGYELVRSRGNTVDEEVTLSLAASPEANLTKLFPKGIFELFRLPPKKNKRASKDATEAS